MNECSSKDASIREGILRLTKPDQTKTGPHFKKKWLSYLFAMPHTSAARSGNISCDRSFLCPIFLWLIASLFPVILFTSHFFPGHSRESGNPGDSARTGKSGRLEKQQSGA
jgi:hypothetical protein